VDEGTIKAVFEMLKSRKTKEVTRNDETRLQRAASFRPWCRVFVGVGFVW